MTDYNELIERLRTESLDSRKAVLSIMDLCMDAADAIETMTAELDATIAGQETLQKELERVKAERDAAVEDLRKHCSCGVCAYVKCYVRGGTEPCNFQYRGPQKED